MKKETKAENQRTDIRNGLIGDKFSLTDKRVLELKDFDKASKL